jgi:carbon-monoxide dehydrogenase large subunit
MWAYCYSLFGLSTRIVGTYVKRKEDSELITGRGLFVDDVKLPGLLYAAFLRSPYAHARIKSIDTSKALSYPGVRYVLTGKEAKESMPLPIFPCPYTVRTYEQYVLAWDKVKYVGEPVAAVVADDRYIAEDALELIDVEYEVLPPVVDPEMALELGAPVIHDEWGDNELFHQTYSFGDTKKAFEEAAHIFEIKMNTGRVQGVPLETRGVVASYDTTFGTLTVWASTQIPHFMRSWIQLMCGIPEPKIRVIAKDVGGAFGNKMGYADEIVICWLSIKLGKPVKWIETRSEHFVATQHSRNQRHWLQVATDNEGRILGIKHKYMADMGAYTSMCGVDMILWVYFYLPLTYKFQNYDVDLIIPVTNKTIYGIYRGFGMSLASFVMERTMDIIAKKLGIDPVEIRKRNMIKNNEFPFVTASGSIYDLHRFEDCLNLALEKIDYKKFREEQAELRRKGRYLGLGIAQHIECSACDEKWTSGLPGWEVARVRVETLGKVSVFTGICPSGQGTKTTIAQIVAQELGVPVDDVEVFCSDTSLTPIGLGTWGSRNITSAGSAALVAARKVKEKILRIAASYLEANPKDLDIKDSRVFVKGSGELTESNSISLENIAWRAYVLTQWLPEGLEPGLEAEHKFLPPKITPPTQGIAGKINQSPTYSNAVQIAIVEVNPKLGDVILRRLIIVHDCGVQVNPKIVDGQIIGGVLHGLGHALLEEHIYDENGQLLTGTFQDYMVPTATYMPNVEVYSIETPSPSIEGGFRGVGEGGLISAPGAIVNAINDALSPFNVELNTFPVTPYKILNALKAKGFA